MDFLGNQNKNKPQLTTENQLTKNELVVSNGTEFIREAGHSLEEGSYCGPGNSMEEGSYCGTGNSMEEGSYCGTGRFLEEGSYCGTGRFLEEGSYCGPGNSMEEGSYCGTGHSMEEGSYCDITASSVLGPVSGLISHVVCTVIAQTTAVHRPVY